MDIDFRFTAGSNTMQQYHILFHEIEKHLIVSCLLSIIEWVYGFWMWLTTDIKSTHFLFVGHHDLPVYQGLDHRRSTVTLIHQFLTSYFCDRYRRCFPY